MSHALDAEDLARCHQVMAKRARTFRWAALLLERRDRDAAAVLYAFCRAVDDAADEATDDASAHADLDRLADGLRGEGPSVGRAVAALASERALPLGAARDLIAGVRGDLQPVRVRDDAALLRYAYLVAGTVGLMMSALLRARDVRAWRHAVDLGIAMQITNICRDVAEDAARGRVYLPERRLRAVGTSPAEVLAGTAPAPAVAQVVSDLLAIADERYASAERGTGYLPARGRLVVLVASKLYRAIGLQLRRRGCDPFAGRAVVGPAMKLVWCLVAVMAWVGTLVRPYRPIGAAGAGS